MSCILRASGKEFDVDLYTKGRDIEFTQIYRKGEPCLPRTKPDGPKNQFSGIGIEVSGADFNQMKLQLEHAQDFLAKNSELITELASFHGVENVVLDFGIETKEPFFSSYTFPAQLALQAAKLGISLCISTYPSEENAET